MINTENSTKIIDYEAYSEEAVQLFLHDEELMGNKSKVAIYLHTRDNLIEEVNLDTFRKILNREMLILLADQEIVTTNVKLAKKEQKQRDNNRIERKAFRQDARIENAVAEYAKGLTKAHEDNAKALKKLKFGPLKTTTDKDGVGVIQLSDPHFNEMINLPHNQYDFEIASKRLRLHVNKCMKIFDSEEVKEVVFMVTGDLLNSDRRLDELLNQSTNRSMASVLVQHLLTQMILDIRSRGYKLTIVSVLGNESRVNKEMSFSDFGLSDSYDFTIMASIKQKFDFAGIDGIFWGSIDKVETVVEINGLNWLVAHDINKYTSTQQRNQSAVGRYSQNGIKIDYTIGGHIHYTNVGINFARSSSLAGSNSYNEMALNLSSRAQQMCYVAKDGFIQPTVIDLQNTEKVEGYNIIKELEAYNVKSSGKLHVGTTIFKVVI